MSLPELLAQSTTHIDHLQLRKAALLEEVSKVDEELTVCLARHGRLVNSIAPVAKLPDELLSSIFLSLKGTVVRSNSSSPIASELALSHVSSHWRNVALGTPLLWNTMQVIATPMSDHSQELNRLNAYLTRSADCLLDISIYSEDPITPAPYIAVIATHASQWHQISVSFPSQEQSDLKVLLDYIQPLSTPSLKHLSIDLWTLTGADSARTFYPEACPQILMQGAPALSFLRMSGMAFGHLLPPFNQVATLHIDALPKNILTQAQFQTTLSALPCIQNLSISGVSVQLPRDPFDFPVSTVLPTLSCLRIRGRATSCQRLFSFMELPNLESLTLQEMESFDSVELPQVKSLTLLSCWFGMVEVANLVRSLPAVTSVTVDGNLPLLYGVIKQVDPYTLESTTDSQVTHNDISNPPPWPDLQAFHQLSLDVRDVTEFCLMILRRQASKSPLTALALDRRSRAVLQKKEECWGAVKDVIEVLKKDGRPLWPPGLAFDPDDDHFAYDE